MLKRTFVLIVLGGLSATSVAAAADDGVSLTAKQRQQLREILQKLAANQNGRIDESERRQFGRTIATGKLPLSRTEILEQFDADKNGQLDADERAALARQLLIQEIRSPSVRPSPERPSPDRSSTESSPTSRPTRSARDSRARANAEGANTERDMAPGQRVPSREDIMRRFDKNGDGRLDDDERRQLFQQMRSGMGRGGRGRAAAVNVVPERPSRVDQQGLLERFDNNGDGSLNATERAAAFAALRNHPS